MNKLNKMKNIENFFCKQKKQLYDVPAVFGLTEIAHGEK